MTTCHSDNTLLTLEEFAIRLKVSRSTVFSWLKNGQLLEGRHYFRIGRIVRFFWESRFIPGQAGKQRNSRLHARFVHLPVKDRLNLLSILTIDNTKICRYASSWTKDTLKGG